MKQAFTKEGAAKVLANLYQLSQDELEKEAVALREDFKRWLSTKFEMNTHQTAYLEKLNPKAGEFYGQMGSFALQHRLPITLDIAAKDEDTPPAKDDEQGKIVYTKNSTTAVANDKGEMQAVGELSYCIRY